VEVSLREALREIEGNKFFKVIENGELVKVSYRYNSPKVFDSPLKRELRGITFRKKTGEVVSRPFHKFFNLNETEETKEERFNKEYIFREKLDGTMLHPVLTESGVKLLTQKGFSNPQIEVGEELLKKDEKLLSFTERALRKGLTPIFELVSPKFQLVIPYEKEELILTEIRDNRTGKYLLEELEGELEEREIRVPKKFRGTLSRLKRFLEKAENIEGFVLKDFSVREPFPLFVKVKSPWYYEHHYAFTYLHNIPDHKLFNLFLTEKLDDILSKVLNEKLKKEKEERLKKLLDLYFDLLSLVERLSPFYGSRNFDERLEKEVEKVLRRHKERFEKLDIDGDYLKEAIRIAKNRGKYEAYFGTKFYSLLKRGKLVLKKS